MKDVQVPPVLKENNVNKDVAIFRTTQWRELYKQKMGCEDKDILRAFWIPIEDIIQMYEFYKKYTDLNITAVRGYFAHDPMDPITPDGNIEMLLCPVTADGIDVVDMPPSLLQLGVTTSPIVDFTSPCPTACDTTSVLYSAANVKS